MSEPTADNPLRYWEAEPVLKINAALLAHNGGAWNRIPDRLDCPEPLRRDMAASIDGLVAHGGVVGWKDTRMTITLAAWRPHLPPHHRIVGCFRNPDDVA